ncbi:MAG: YaeQ family protein [Myxococcales bacterium]|nr:YaeQ family protein [Myxococcales bacterium]
MALTSTLFRFHIELSDIDRSLYETLELRVPCHPSEERDRLVLRVLARAILSEEGLEFGRGLSHTEDPALWTRSPGGDILRWIDVGAPAGERLHRASKKARSTHVVTTKHRTVLAKEWAKAHIHQSDAIEVIHLPGTTVSSLADTLDRSNDWFVTIQDNHLTISDGKHDFGAALSRTTLDEFVQGT